MRNLHTHLISHLLVVTPAGVDIAESGCPSCASDLKICTAEIQELILGSLNRAIAGKLLGSVDVLRDSYTGETMVLFVSSSFGFSHQMSPQRIFHLHSVLFFQIRF